MGFRDSSLISSCLTLVSFHWNIGSCFLFGEQWECPSQKHCQRADDGYSKVEGIPALEGGGTRRPQAPSKSKAPGPVSQSYPRGPFEVQKQLV